MIKLIIQIPCFNEEQSLPVTLGDLPATIPGIDVIETLIIDDGSTDRTAEVARAHGVDHIVRFSHNRGLAKAFATGLQACLGNNADIIVNTDADNQYVADDIQKLVQPILEGRAEFVIGARPISEIKHFSWIKKLLQRFGSWVVRIVSGTDIPDAPSGFRAFSRSAALRINVHNDHTYTLETIIQAGQKGMSITSVPVRVNGELRPSRLILGTWSYILRSMVTVLRIFMIYRPVSFFSLLGGIPFGLGVLLGFRWLYLVYVISEPGRAYIPSLILAAIFLIIGVQAWIFGLIASLLATNRTLLEENQLRLRRAEFDDQSDRASSGSSRRKDQP